MPASPAVAASAPAQDVDTELLDIFLEEAHEVLASVDENLNQLGEQPHNPDYLTSVRRSFHTLKGSGRMVGLKDVGEAAWSIEQTLNLWLRQEMTASPALLDLLGEAYSLFSVWVGYLEAPSGVVPNPAALIELSETLRRELETPREKLAAAAIKPQLVEERVTVASAGAETAVSADTPEQLAEEIAFERLASATAGDAGRIEVDEFAAMDIDALGFEPSAVEPGLPAGEVAISAEAEPGPDAPVVGEPGEPQEVEGAVVIPAAAPAAAPVVTPKISVSPLLFEIFSEEARTHLATLARELALIERNEALPTPHEMYRAAHTLAGISATVGLFSINRLGLALEHALLRRDNAAHPESLEALGIVRQAVGELELVLANIADQREPAIGQGLVESLDALYQAGLTREPAVIEASGEGVSVPRVAAEVVLPSGSDVGQAFPEVAFTAPIPAHAPVEAGKLRDEIDVQLLPIFLDEALELNQSIGDRLRAWRNSPGDTETVRTLTRLLHTLKGSARMAGAMNLGELTHRMETRVEQASRAGDASLSLIDELDNDFEIVLQYVDGLQLHNRSAEPEAAEIPLPAADTRPAGEIAEPAAATVEKRSDPLRVMAREYESDVAMPRSDSACPRRAD